MNPNELEQIASACTSIANAIYALQDTLALMGSVMTVFSGFGLFLFYLLVSNLIKGKN